MNLFNFSNDATTRIASLAHIPTDADSVAAQMEYFYNNQASTVVQVDVAGRVTSADGRDKAFAGVSYAYYAPNA